MRLNADIRENERSVADAVLQKARAQERPLLEVDGASGTVECSVPGSGGALRLSVRTGTWRSMWQASDVENGAVSAGAIWTPLGGDGGFLEVTVPPNISGTARRFSLRVRRLNGNGTIDGDTAPVCVTLHQPRSEHLLVVSPHVRGGPVLIDGFDPRPSTARGGVYVRRKFSVTLAAPSCYTYSVRSSFRKDCDAFLTPHAPAGNSISACWSPDMALQDNLCGLKNGESFYLNVFRTGPGDPTIAGTLTVTAVPNNPNVGESQTVVVDVSILTPCVVGDVLLPTDSGALLVADRNVGASPRIREGRFVSARNFANDTRMRVTGSDSEENTNNEWKGDYYPWEARDREAFLGAGDPGFVRRHWLCPDDGRGSNLDESCIFSPWYRLRDADLWHVPSCDELAMIARRLVFSKGRVFLVSSERDRDTGMYVGCYFPLSGLDSSPANVYGYYWSGTVFSGGSYNAYCLSLAPPGAMVSFGSKRYMYSVRCVRTVPAAEMAAHSMLSAATPSASG